MRIKAVTLWEPWATLMALELKLYETRSWYHRYRGLIAVHASERWREDQEWVLRREPYASALGALGFSQKEDFPLGCIVSVHRLDGIYATEKLKPKLQVQDKDLEIAFGNYANGRKAWHMPLVHRLAKPLPATGSRGLWWWDVPAGIAKKLKVAA